MTKRQITFGVLTLAVVGALGATAYAARTFHEMHGHHGEFMKKHASAMIEDALDAAKVTPAERKAVEAARDRAFAAIAENRGKHEGHFAAAIQLFEADRIDTAKVAAMRAEQEARMQKTGDAIVQAITDAHDALTPTERNAVADYLAGHRPGRHGARFGADMMKRMVSNRLDAALDEIGVTAAQRTAIEAARDQLFSTLEANHPAGGMLEHADKALALFRADRIDAAAVKALRDEQHAKMKATGDAIVQALTELHDVLTPAQRQALVKIAEEHRARFGGHGHGGAPMGEE